MPVRLQRKRTKGYRLPPDAVYVGRPTRWGNPYKVIPVRRSGPFDVINVDRDRLVWAQSTGIESARHIAVDRFRQAVDLGWGDFPSPAEIRAELYGKNLACWCALDQPCHADVLLAIANPDAGARL